MHRSRSTLGLLTDTVSPKASGPSYCSRTMAFSGIGHISSHTMQSRKSAQGMQRFWSMDAFPMTCCLFSSSVRGGIACTGQAQPQALQA